MENNQEKKETHDLFITENKRERAEAEDASPEQDLANDEVYKSQYSKPTPNVKTTKWGI